MQLIRKRHGRETVPYLGSPTHEAPLHSLLPEAPQEWNACIGWLHEHWQQAEKAFEQAEKNGSEAAGMSPPALPATAATRIFCAGLNYTDHAAETGRDLPAYPIFFTRFAQSFVADGEPLLAPSHSRHYDYEAELVAVIGRKAKHIDVAEALDYVFGYTIGMDGSVRDLQKRAVQWTLGKNADHSGSLLSTVTHASELPEGAAGLSITTDINGERLQDGNSRDMIFPVAELVSTLSQCLTLLPGDLIFTGTPAGVGYVRSPARYLTAGDTITVSIEQLGELRNEVVAETTPD